MSISKLTNPSTQTVRGILGRAAVDMRRLLPAILRADKLLLACKDVRKRIRW